MRMHPLEPAGEDLLRRAQAHNVAEREYPIAAARLFEMFEEGPTWSKFFPVIRKVEWTSPRPFEVGTTRTVSVIGGQRLEEVFWAWKPGAQMGFAVTAASSTAIQGLVEVYDFLPLDDGRCKLRWEMGMELSGRMRSFEARMPSSFARAQSWCMNRLERIVARQARS